MSISDPFDSPKKDWEYVQQQKFQTLKHLNDQFENGEMQIVCKKKAPARGLNRMTFLLDSMEAIAKDGNLNQTDLKVLLFLLSQMDFENWIHIPLAMMSKRLGVAAPHISTSINNLVEYRYITKEKVGRSNYYRFNPEMGWKGKDVDWDKVVDLSEIRERQKNAGSLPHRPGPAR